MSFEKDKRTHMYYYMQQGGQKPGPGCPVRLLRGWLSAEETLLRWVLLAKRGTGRVWEHRCHRSSFQAPSRALRMPSKYLHYHRDHSFLCSNSCCPLPATGRDACNHLLLEHGMRVCPTLGRMVFSGRERQQLVTCQMALRKSGQRLDAGL